MVGRNTQERDVIARLFLRNETFQAYQEGVIGLEQREWSRAVTKFRRALELEPDHVDILIRLAQALLMQREGPSIADEAKQILERALATLPGEPQARLWLGRALLDLKDWDAALTQFRRVAQTQPDWEWTSVWTAEALVGKRENPVPFLQSTVRDHPLRVSALVALNRYKADRKLTTRWLLSRWEPYRALKENFHGRQRVLGSLGVDFETAQDLENRWRSGWAAAQSNSAFQAE